MIIQKNGEAVASSVGFLKRTLYNNNFSFLLVEYAFEIRPHGKKWIADVTIKLSKNMSDMFQKYILQW